MDQQQPQYKIIIGLGNPGEEYANTYHNVGFLAVDHLISSAKNMPIKVLTSKKIAYAKKGNVIFIKPSTFMNESGIAVKNALRQFKVSPEEVLVIHDDSDIAIGEYKLSFERGAGGHKGIESIITHLKTKKFWRLRIGIRPQTVAGVPRKKALDFVLKNISKTNQHLLKSVFITIAKQIERL